MEMLKTKVENNITKIQIGLELNPNKTEVNAEVELDIENQSRFVEMVNGILDEGIANIIVDMSLVSYIDSSGLWAIFEGHKKASQKNGKVVLLNPTRDVRRVLDITKMSSKIAIVKSEKAAIKEFQTIEQ